MFDNNALQSLKTLLRKGQVFTDPGSRLSYEVDAGLDAGVPDGVVFPESLEDVEKIARWAGQSGMPLVGRGAGTGLSGGAVAEHGGLIVEFSRMNRIIEIDAQGRSALVEPGLINLHLDERVRANDLYFPPDPASQRASTIGGNVSENSGGPHCYKYGVMTNYVTGMQVVLASGQRVQVGGRALDYPEYDFCGVLTGSEGMLALMTSINVRLVRNPPGVKTMLAVFDSVEQAGNAVSAVIAAGLVPATMEMMDQKIIRIVEDFVHGGLPTEAQAMLIVEVDGYPESLEAQIEDISNILSEKGAYNLRVAATAEERNAIWFARKSAAGALARLAPAHYTVDVTVPRSRLAETLAEVNAICERYDLRVGYVFHAGDGNLHPLIIVDDPRDEAFMRRVHAAGRETVEIAVQKDGSLSGEHGVGIEKRAFMPLMFNEAELSAMLDIKHIFDPHNLLNPGKMFPETATTSNEPSASPRRGRFIAPSADVSARIAPTAADDVEQPKSTMLARHPERSEGSEALSHESLAAQILRSAQDDMGGRYAPTSAQEAAQFFQDCAQNGTRVRIAGGGADVARATGRAPIDRAVVAPTLYGQGIGAILDTSSLAGIKHYAPDDLYITVGAGTPLSEIQAFLLLNNKFLAVASPWPETTIGGLIATNSNAPLRMRYGAIRDNVLCMTVALADGRVIRAGRPVIKNVAGFDIVKLFTGSYGTLGLVTEITLKLAVNPRARRSLLIPVDDLRYGLIWARQLQPLALVASAIVLAKGGQGDRQGGPYPLRAISESPFVLMYSAEGMVEDVQAELAQVRKTLEEAGAPEAVEIEGIVGTDVWASLLSTHADKVQVRVGVPVKDAPVYTQDLSALLNAGAFLFDIGSGMIYTALDAGDTVAEDIKRLRVPALQYGGYALVTHVPEGWQGELDCWGYRPDTLDLMRALKAKWDPHNILDGGWMTL